MTSRLLLVTVDYVSGGIDGGWQLGASVAPSEPPTGSLESSVGSRIVYSREIRRAPLGASSRSHAAYIVNYLCHNTVSHITILSHNSWPSGGAMTDPNVRGHGLDPRRRHVNF
jgi:hypothetical protein